ncbi:MAG: META domain-containing protein, partial [Chloroflexi bacterium]|nr:META domain-containing protein [Chloroflexota bacterium]
QDMNPVTSDGLPLQYIYQGFTNDGEYLVAFFYQVNSSSLPTNAEVSEPFNTAVSNGQYDAFIAQQAAALDALDLSDWEPVLTSLDDLVGSLTIIGIPESGIQNQLWQLTGHSNGESIEPLTNTDNYTVVYLPNGVMKYQTDCNSGNGTYDVTGGVVGSIAMGLGASTMAECGPNSYADQMIANFVAAQSYLVQPGGHQMELVQPTGGSLVYINLGSADEGDGSEPEVELPTPEANVPYGRVTTPLGVNVRTGPDELYPIIGTAPQGAESLIIGRSADGEWWVVPVPVSGTDGWVSAAYMETINTENMPIIPPPPPPIPTATPTATPLPEASINFWADSTTINQGECTTLRWDVENIQAVWVYPLGEPYDQYPITGQGNQEVCPTTTTTYEMRVLKTDGSVELRQITIMVIDTDPLANTNWQVVSFDGGSQVPLPATTLTAVFGNNNNISGDSGCNTFNGGYTASGSIISIGPLATTQKFCQEGINNQEHAYLAALQSAATYTISGSQLILRNASGVEVARFNRIG